MNPALRTDARLLRLLIPEAMPAQPRADWRVRGSRPYAPSLSASRSLPCPCAHAQPAALCASRRVRLAESISECDEVRGAECGGEGLVDAVLRIFQQIFVYSPQAR